MRTNEAAERAHLAELEEARGDTEAAIQHCGQFLDLRIDADPAVQPTVRNVKQRVAKACWGAIASPKSRTPPGRAAFPKKPHAGRVSA